MSNKVPCGGFELSSSDFYMDNKTLQPFLTGGGVQYDDEIIKDEGKYTEMVEFQGETFKKVYEVPEGSNKWTGWETFGVRGIFPTNDFVIITPITNKEIKDEETGFYVFLFDFQLPTVIWKSGSVYINIEALKQFPEICIRAVSKLGNVVETNTTVLEPFVQVKQSLIGIDLNLSKGGISYLYDCYPINNFTKIMFPLFDIYGSLAGYLWMEKSSQGTIPYKYFLFKNSFVFEDSCYQFRYKDALPAFKSNLRRGLVVQSPDRTYFYINVSNDGTLSATQVYHQ